MRWGLIPAWAKDPSKARQPINAMAETGSEKPMFRDAFKRRRRLTNWREWVEAPGGIEPPHRSFADCSLNHLGTAPN